MVEVVKLAELVNPLEHQEAMTGLLMCLKDKSVKIEGLMALLQLPTSFGPLVCALFIHYSRNWEKFETLLLAALDSVSKMGINGNSIPMDHLSNISKYQSNSKLQSALQNFLKN